MIQYIDGDIFHSPASVLVNPVNTQGFMGKGLALAFKNKYSRMFESYQKACNDCTFSIGQLMLFREIDYSVLLFPTKKSYRQPSRLEYIEAGLEKFVKVYADLGISSIAFPKLGCGYGDLDWADVRPLMEQHLSTLPISVYVYVAQGFVSMPEITTKRKEKKRILQDPRDMSFAGLLSAIKEELTSMASCLEPYKLQMKEVCWQLLWQDDALCMENKEDRTEIYGMEESEIFQLWDEIRGNKVFAEGNETHKKVFYAFLEKLGYLNRIGLQQQDEMVYGYQLYAGAGRAFLYKEMG